MFEISYSPTAAPPGFDLQKATIIAQSPGFGLQWAHWPDIDAAKPFVLRLERDLPIRGRIVDLQGSPLAGIRVAVLGFERMADGNLDAALASMRSDPSGFSRKRSLSDLVERVAGHVIRPVTTDTEGRFSLPGLGAERLVRLEFLGPNIAYTKAEVATRTKVPPVPQVGYERLQVFGAEFTLTAPPTRPIVGTIRDAKTGKASSPASEFKVGGFWTLPTSLSRRWSPRPTPTAAMSCEACPRAQATSCGSLPSRIGRT